MKSHVSRIELFISEELETRKLSFLPGPDEEESGYIGSAVLALASLQALSVYQTELLKLLREASALMPLGTAKRADWISRAGKAVLQGR